jgi:hypothetical protein
MEPKFTTEHGHLIVFRMPADMLDSFNIVMCYATEDAVRIGNSFITIPITRHYNHNYFLRGYTITIIHVRNYNHLLHSCTG